MIDQNTLAHFTGTTEWFRVGPPFSDVIFTEGVHYVAEEGAAQWLVVAIAAHLTIKKSFREDRILFWKLSKRAPEATAAVLTAVQDSGLPPVVKQVIPYTDFPLQEIEIWSSWDGQYWTLYLPSEH